MKDSCGICLSKWLCLLLNVRAFVTKQSKPVFQYALRLCRSSWRHLVWEKLSSDLEEAADRISVWLFIFFHNLELS